MIEMAIFAILSAMVLIPAFFVVTVKNVFHAALFLIVSLLGVAGMYAMLAADFLFAVQLLVYAGGVMVILLFVVLLSGKPSDWSGTQVNEKAWAAGLYAILFAVAVVTTLLKYPLSSLPLTKPEVSSGKLGQLLLGDMILPFEIISLILVAALVGAIYFAKKRKSS